jgi:CRISPR-associated protein Cas1
VRVELDEELRAMTLAAVNGLRLVAAGGQMPPPLRDSPKCPRCSLVGICLPDEVNFLKRGGANPRPLSVAHDTALPLYVQARGGSVRKRGETLEVFVDDNLVTTARLIDVSQVVLMGNIYLSTPTLHELMSRETPVTWHSYGGWFLGHTQGTGHKNVELRTAQYRGSFDERVCLALAKGFVRTKIQNCRTLMRRNWRGATPPDRVLAEIKHDAEQGARAGNLDALLGFEGSAAARYFGAFSGLIKQDPNPDSLAFDFTKRNRRPPLDPVNALLSYAYALLVRTWTVTLTAVGFDPYRGFYHQPRYGRPALALDMMERFRPLVADSAVIQAINNGEVKPTDFISAAGGGEPHQRRTQALHRRLRAAPRPRDHPSALRIPPELSETFRGPGKTPQPLPGRRHHRVPELHDPLSRLFIVTYDISDPKRWRAVFSLMNG